MRTLAVTQNITVDGSIEMLDDWFDPANQDDELLAEIRRQDDAADALLLGRQTFEDFRGYWRHREDDPTGIGVQLDAFAKYVVSSTLDDPAWENTTVLTGDAVQLARELKDGPGQDVVVTGSIALTHALLAADVVDELRLFVYPVVQGRGRRLFPDGVDGRRFTSGDVRRFPGGVVLLRYARA